MSINSVSNSVNNFNPINNSPSNTVKPTNNSTQPKVESFNKSASNASEQTNKGFQSIASGVSSSTNILKSSQQQVNTFTSKVKTETEKLVNSLEGFSKTDPVAVILLRQNVGSIERNSQALKQSIDFVKKGVGAFEQGVNKGVNLLKEATQGLQSAGQAGFETTKETLNKIQTQSETTTKVVNQGLNNAENAITGQIGQGLQAIKYGANIVVGDTKKGAELIKSGAETIKKAVETVGREVSQVVKNVEDASSKLNPFIIGITPQLFRKSQTPTQTPTQTPAQSNQPSNFNPALIGFLPQFNSRNNASTTQKTNNKDCEPNAYPIDNQQETDNAKSITNSTKTNSDPCEPEVTKEVIKIDIPSYSDCEPQPPCINFSADQIETTEDNQVSASNCPEAPRSQQVPELPSPQATKAEESSSTTKLDPLKKYDISNNEPPKINRDNLSETDKLLVETFKLDSFKPGEKKSFSVDVLGKVGEGLYGGVGVNQKVTIERDLDNSNKFRVTIEAEPRLEGGLEGKDLGEGVTAKGSVSSKFAITTETDLSKKGEATQLAGFLAHTTAISALPLVSAPIVLLEQLPGVNLPGEPIDYIKSHIKSAEVTGGTGQELNAKVLSKLGLSGTLGEKLNAGAKVDFNDDGTYTLTTNLGTSAKTDAKALSGTSAISINTNLGAIEFGLSIEASTKIDKDGKITDTDVRFKLTGRGQGLNKGGDAELSVSAKDLTSQLPPEIASRFAKAISSNDIEEAKKIFQNEIVPNYPINFDVKVRKFTDNKIGSELSISKEGTGIDGALEAEQEIPTYVREGKGRLKLDGTLEIGDQKIDLGFLKKETQKPTQNPTTSKPAVGITLQKLNRGLFGSLFS